MKSIDKIMNSDSILADVKQVIESGAPYQLLKGKTVFLTGANGLIGSQIIRTFIYMNHKFDMNIKIIAGVRVIEKAKELLGEDKSLLYYEYHLENEVVIMESIDYIIHCAAATQSKKFIDCPSEVIISMVQSTIHILELARIKRAKVLFLSSLEVYGVGNFLNGEIVKEQDYGYIDLLNARSSYVEGKRVGELLCYSYTKEKQVDTCIARLCQTFGSNINIEDKRMFAQFVKVAISGENIVLFSTGETVRSYCYLSDTISGLLYVLLLGKNGEAYNIANEEMTMSVKEIAELVAKQYGIEVEYQLEDIDGKGYLPVFQMQMSAEKLKALGWNPKIGMKESFDKMIVSMKENKK